MNLLQTAISKAMIGLTNSNKFMPLRLSPAANMMALHQSHVAIIRVYFLTAS